MTVHWAYYWTTRVTFIMYFGRRYNFGVLGHFFSGPLQFFYLLIFVFWIILLYQVFLKFSVIFRVVWLSFSFFYIWSFTSTITTAPPLSAFLITTFSHSHSSFMLVLSFFVKLLYGFCSFSSFLGVASMYVNMVWWFLFGFFVIFKTSF